MRIVPWGLSDVGCKREHNEDSLLVAPDLNLFAVADGMGGHVGGGRASKLAVETLEREIRAAELHQVASSGPDPEDPPGNVLSEATRTASRTIYDEAQEKTELHGMGTTLTAILLHDGRAYLVHVGDSRCYLFRDGRIEQLTSDHSWIEEQVRAGYMTADEAQQSSLKHVVTRSVGFEREVDVDALAMPVLMGDCYLLCSDGLSNYLNDAQLRDYLIRGYYSEVPRRLVDTANKLGGDDNITVVVVYVANDSREDDG